VEASLSSAAVFARVMDEEDEAEKCPNCEENPTAVVVLPLKAPLENLGINIEHPFDLSSWVAANVVQGQISLRVSHAGQFKESENITDIYTKTQRQQLDPSKLIVGKTMLVITNPGDSDDFASFAIQCTMDPDHLFRTVSDAKTPPPTGTRPEPSVAPAPPESVPSTGTSSATLAAADNKTSSSVSSGPAPSQPPASPTAPRSTGAAFPASSSSSSAPVTPEVPPPSPSKSPAAGNPSSPGSPPK